MQIYLGIFQQKFFQKSVKILQNCGHEFGLTFLAHPVITWPCWVEHLDLLTHEAHYYKQKEANDTCECVEHLNLLIHEAHYKQKEANDACDLVEWSTSIS